MTAEHAEYRPLRARIAGLRHVAPGQRNTVTAIHRTQVAGRIGIEEMPVGVGGDFGHPAHDHRWSELQLRRCLDAVLIARRGDEFYAIGATCTHYNGPLAEGLVVGDTVRCPWHHARFCLRTGEAIGAPAFNRVSCWRVEKSGERAVLARVLHMALHPFEDSWAGRSFDNVAYEGDREEEVRWTSDVPRAERALQCSCSS